EVTSQVVGAKPVAGTGGLQRLGSVTGVGIARGEDPRGRRGNYYEQQKCASQSQAEFGYPTAASAFEFWSAGVICWRCCSRIGLARWLVGDFRGHRGWCRVNNGLCHNEMLSITSHESSGITRRNGRY